LSGHHGTHSCSICIEEGIDYKIAQAIGKELQAAGHVVDVTDVGTVTSPLGYNAVVLGGPIYMGKMMGELGKFVKRNYNELRDLPIAGFIVGLGTVSNDPASVTNAEKVLQAALSPLQPVAVTAFAGRLDPAKLSWFQHWITKNVKSPVGDFRDWSAIAAWAKELPGRLKV
jgi:menaquinone-dependent protoporphyrinogen oxidase